jgi:hypothetical protein
MRGLTVLVIDEDAGTRAQTVSALRDVGMDAVGVYVASEAVALLDGLATDAVLVRSDDEDEALAYLRTRTILVRVPLAATVEETVATLLTYLSPEVRPDTLN